MPKAGFCAKPDLHWSRPMSVFLHLQTLAAINVRFPENFDIRRNQCLFLRKFAQIALWGSKLKNLFLNGVADLGMLRKRRFLRKGNNASPGRN
jgi:hypothetical protein